MDNAYLQKYTVLVGKFDDSNHSTLTWDLAKHLVGHCYSQKS